MGAPIFGLLVISAMAVFNLYAIFKMVFFSEVIVLNQTSLEIQRWLFAFNLSRRSFPNSTIENLRYDEWSGGKAGTQNGIRFESTGETFTFARQATHSDSWDLIDKMLEVYKFPMQNLLSLHQPSHVGNSSSWLNNRQTGHNSTFGPPGVASIQTGGFCPFSPPSTRD